jgi:hypothetical protein
MDFRRLYAIERGFSLEEARRIADALDCPREYVIGPAECEM